MKGETQMIERILQGLSDEVATRRELPMNKTLKDLKESIFSVVFAIILLNTDLHHPDVVDKMQFESFEKNFRLVIPDEQVVSKRQLTDVYEDIKVGKDRLPVIFV